MRNRALKTAVDYSKDRISIKDLTLDNYITTDNLLPNKLGIVRAINLPKQGGKVTKFEINDILVANIRPYLRKIWYSDRIGGCSADVLVYRVKEEYCPKFIYYSMFRDDFFVHTMKGSKGTKMPRGDKKQMLNFLIPTIEKSEQCNIAALLSSFDYKIELNNRINAELEAMAKTLYDYWFVQFDFPDANGKPYKSSGGKMVYSKELKREIPEEWEVDKLSKSIQTILDHRGKTPKKLGGNWIADKDGIIALSAKNIKKEKLVNLDQANRISSEIYEKWMSEKLEHWDILMTSEAPLGEFFLIRERIKFCMSQRLFAIRSDKSKVIPSYLYFELSRGNGYSQIMGKQSGSTVFGIRQDELRLINILLPKIDIQKSYDKIVTPILDLIEKNDIQNTEIGNLRDWLLPMLMNGQVKVVDEKAKKEYTLNDEVSMAAEP